MTDYDHIAFGAHCTWWDSFDKAGLSEEGLPVCPHCHGVLFETNDIEGYWDSVDAYERDLPAPGYHRFVAWQRGKCFASPDIAHAAYRKVQ